MGVRVQNVAQALADENISVAVYDMRFAKPLDEEMLRSVLPQYKTVITVEDGAVAGGFGSAVEQFANDNNIAVRVVTLGLPDRFIEHGSPEELYAECGLDFNGIANAIRNSVK